MTDQEATVTAPPVPLVTPEPYVTVVEKAPEVHDISIHDAVGRIMFTARVDEHSYNISPDKQRKIDGHYDKETYYVLDGVATERPTQVTVLNGMVLAGMPTDSIVPVKLHITSKNMDKTYDIAGEATVELDFPSIGQYVVSVDAFPYITEIFAVNV